MPDYKQSSEAGTKWRRAFYVGIKNELKGEKGITYHAEDCIQLADGHVMHDRQGLTYSEPFTQENALTEFPLGPHPITGEDMGNATYMMAYIILAAMFAHIAAKQDAAAEMPEPLIEP